MQIHHCLCLCICVWFSLKYSLYLSSSPSLYLSSSLYFFWHYFKVLFFIKFISYMFYIEFFWFIRMVFIVYFVSFIIHENPLICNRSILLRQIYLKYWSLCCAFGTFFSTVLIFLFCVLLPTIILFILHPFWVIILLLKLIPTEIYSIMIVPACASGSDKNTSVFCMLGVTGSGPHFRKPENFWKGRFQMFRPTRSSEFSRCWVMVSLGVLKIMRSLVSQLR